MKFVTPKHSNGEINRAGKILVAPEDFTAEDRRWADELMAHWRAAHGYPINTFQATLRHRLKLLDRFGVVAQRLKRTPSIVIKLRLQKKMQLARMQDIGGLRAILGTVDAVRKLEYIYRNSRFTHELVSSKNYLDNPKANGYRGVHLIYRYQNPIATEYNGLSLELQLRTDVIPKNFSSSKLE